MNFPQAISSVFRQYAIFSGRASRSEYWYFMLFTLIATAVATILDRATWPDNELLPFNAILTVIILLPGIAVGVRRLHDVGRTGWWTLILFTIVGIIPLLIWACTKSMTGVNRYGPNPLRGAANTPWIK